MTQDQTQGNVAELDRRSDTAAVVAWARRQGLPAYLVGRWVWVQFDSMPPEATRRALAANGFRWVPRRGAWAHPCGFFTKSGTGNPWVKYGAVPVAELPDAAAAAEPGGAA